MKYIVTLMILIILLVGCASLDQVRTKNRENLVRLSIGMPKSEVLQVMGAETITVDTGNQINNPYRVETLKGKDGQVYEVLFYYTDVKKIDYAITDDELTPIVIENGKVIGWGWGFLNDNVTKYKYQIDIR